MTKVRHLLEVAQFKRNKAYCLLRDAPSMLDAGDRAHLVQYAKFFEEEAVKLEGRVGGIYARAAAQDKRHAAKGGHAMKKRISR